jgi:predicted DNA-binding transcriptional regulator YafY
MMSAVEGLLRRADRLFRIIQVLRRSQRPTTAIAIAGELETSPRTIYRDIAQLMADRVPIRGEAGVGYILEDGFDMPPLMLTPDEIDAAILGAHWVMGRGDAALARGAADLLAKIGIVLPEHLRQLLLEPDLTARSYRARPADSIDMGRVRAAIRSQTKIALVYSDEEGRRTRRTVWPIAVSYWDVVLVIIAWCELRNDFRHFRADRVVAADFLAQRYATPRTRLKVVWKKQMQESCTRMVASRRKADAARLEELVRNEPASRRRDTSLPRRATG